MSDDCKRPRWLLWSALATVATIALYAASYGPVCWLAYRGFFSPDAIHRIDDFYDPLWDAATMLKCDGTLYDYRESQMPR